MAKQEIKVVGRAYKMPAEQLDNQRCVNWYLISDPTGKFPIALMPRPGLDLFYDGSTHNSVRGSFALNEKLYVVIDNTLYSFDSNGNKTSLGTLLTSVGRVTFTANSNQLFLTDKYNGYVYQIDSNANYDAGDFYRITEASSAIGSATFSGSGPLDDMTTSGTYTGTTSKSYQVEIDSAGTSTTADTFRWSDDGGSTWNATGVTITGSTQTLNDGVQITFLHTYGHALHDKWDFDTTIESAFYPPIVAAYQDGYGIYIKQVSNTWYISNINDFATVNALDQANANAFPDNLVVAISLREELWLVGRETTEVWYNTGDIQFPFERRSNLLINYGTEAPYSACFGGDNILFWLGRNKEGTRDVIKLEGYNAVPVADEAISAALDSYSVVDDAWGFVHEWDGHLFYTLIFPTEDKCWCYDNNLGTWHERLSILDNEAPYADSSETREGRWRVNSYSYFAGEHILGDFENGNLYKLDRDTYDDNGTYFPCERVTKVFQKNLSRLSINSLEIDFQKGVGLTSGQGSDPKAMLQVSRDGGITWSKELWRTIGALGKYKTRTKWNRLGTSRSFLVKLRITDPVYRVVLGAVADMEVSES